MSNKNTQNAQAKTNDEQPQPSAAKAEEVELTSESVPGGRFIVNGRVVNCNGEEIE